MFLVAVLSAVHPLRMRNGCHLESQHHQTHWIFGWPAVAGWRWDGVVGQQPRCTQRMVMVHNRRCETARQHTGNDREVVSRALFVARKGTHTYDKTNFRWVL